MKKILFVTVLLVLLLLVGCAKQEAVKDTEVEASEPVVAVEQPAAEEAAEVLPEEPVVPGEGNVIVLDDKFEPATITIKVDGSVTWTVNAEGKHLLSSSQYRFNSGTLEKGGVFTQKFDRVGSFDYVCALHPQVRGKIIVE